MNKKIANFKKNFAHFSNILPGPVGVEIAQTVVRFAHFQVQARKGGVWGGVGGVWGLSKEQELGEVGGDLGKMREHWAKELQDFQYWWSTIQLGNACSKSEN